MSDGFSSADGSGKESYQAMGAGQSSAKIREDLANVEQGPLIVVPLVSNAVSGDAHVYEGVKQFLLLLQRYGLNLQDGKEVHWAICKKLGDTIVQDPREDYVSPITNKFVVNDNIKVKIPYFESVLNTIRKYTYFDKSLLTLLHLGITPVLPKTSQTKESQLENIIKTVRIRYGVDASTPTVSPESIHAFALRNFFYQTCIGDVGWQHLVRPGPKPKTLKELASFTWLPNDVIGPQDSTEVRAAKQFVESLKQQIQHPGEPQRRQQAGGGSRALPRRDSRGRFVAASMGARSSKRQ